MFRFLVLALPLVILTLGLSHFAVEALDLTRPEGLPAPHLLGMWLLESMGLVALYLLVRERGLGRWSAGLASTWTAWIFRGPVLVLTVAGASRLSPSAWWRLALAWLVVYTVCGLLMGSVARGLERPAERAAELSSGVEGDPAAEAPEPPAREDSAAEGAELLETAGRTPPERTT